MHVQHYKSRSCHYVYVLGGWLLGVFDFRPVSLCPKEERWVACQNDYIILGISDAALLSPPHWPPYWCHWITNNQPTTWMDGWWSQLTWEWERTWPQDSRSIAFTFHIFSFEEGSNLMHRETHKMMGHVLARTSCSPRLRKNGPQFVPKYLRLRAKFNDVPPTP